MCATQVQTKAAVHRQDAHNHCVNGGKARLMAAVARSPRAGDPPYTPGSLMPARMSLTTCSVATLCPSRYSTGLLYSTKAGSQRL